MDIDMPVYHSNEPKKVNNGLYKSQDLRNYINNPETSSSGTLRDEEYSGEHEDHIQTVKFCSMYKK